MTLAAELTNENIHVAFEPDTRYEEDEGQAENTEHSYLFRYQDDGETELTDQELIALNLNPQDHLKLVYSDGRGKVPVVTNVHGDSAWYDESGDCTWHMMKQGGII